MEPQAFDEAIFVRALMERVEDAKKFYPTFKPEWLKRSELAPVLNEIFVFLKQYGIPPSLPTLHKVFEDKDNEAYQLRYKGVLGEIEAQVTDQSDTLYTLDRARDFAIIRSFQQLGADTGFLEVQSELRGKTVLDLLDKWRQQFDGAQIDRTMNIKDATDHLVQSTGFLNESSPVSCGIKPIDDWCGGGLRPRNLAIILGSTGQGKSVVLSNIAVKIANIEEKRVWYITNELALEEQTERILARLTGINLHTIMSDPGIVYGQALGKHWARGLAERLWITEINRECSTNDIESEMTRLAALTGWKPQVIVLDYLERMKPNERGHDRAQSWNWLGAIAGDLVRLAKKHGILIWTAGQANRGGMSGENPELSNAQGSIKHLQEASVVVSIKKDRHPDFSKDTDVITFKALKVRQSRNSGTTASLEANLSSMMISNNEVELPSILINGTEQDGYEEESSEPKRRRPKKQQRRY